MNEKSIYEMSYDEVVREIKEKNKELYQLSDRLDQLTMDEAKEKLYLFRDRKNVKLILNNSYTESVTEYTIDFNSRRQECERVLRIKE